jgi:hypothetical protein
MLAFECMRVAAEKIVRVLDGFELLSSLRVLA